MRVQPATDTVIAQTALTDVRARARRGAIAQALALLATAAPVILVAVWSVLFAL
ncbi:hypothetical protein [Euzebya sp.]|uniref:hypothetical protein n=1 Tax=Euzebya sp. TaxID=1971409 RepID=UPI0035112540